jgi:hypothetical protein
MFFITMFIVYFDYILSIVKFSTPTTANIRTGTNVNVGDNGFKLKPALINMVQASLFCGKAHEDVSAHL